MMTFRWSWIFILNFLLVHLKNVASYNDDHGVNDVHQIASEDHSSIYLVDDSPGNAGALIGCVIAGVVVALAALGYCYVTRPRSPPRHVEEGVVSPGVKDAIPELKSAFSPDEKVRWTFGRIRQAFIRHKKSEDSLPVYQAQLPPGSTDSIGPPPPVVPSFALRYPNSLERNYSKPLQRNPPPLLKGYPELLHPLSSIESVSSDEFANESSQRKVQVPPKATLMLQPAPSRPLPGFSGVKSAGSKVPRSGLRRESWLLRHPLKHPFIPSPNLDAYSRYPPGSPLGQYQPSRRHLEARLKARSPRRAIMNPLLGYESAKETPRREPVRQQPIPLPKDEETMKQAPLVEALRTAEFEGKRTLTGYRTALPLGTSKPSPASGKFLQ